MLPYTKFRFYCTKVTTLIIHPIPNRGNIGICYFRWRHASSVVNRICVCFDKFWENVDISVRIFIGKVFVELIANHSISNFYDGAFHFGIFIYLKLKVLMFQHVLKVFISKFFAFICSHPNRAASSEIFRALKVRLKC